jgi:hypothetical protein
MFRAAATVVLAGLVSVPLAAQGRYGNQGIPPGHLPPAGMCRVWYDNLPPGHQPPPMNCNQAERVASRDRNARVIYGSNTNGRDNPWWDRSGRYPDYGQYPDNGSRYPGRTRGGVAYQNVPFRNGFDDGYEKGREDAQDRDRYDPTRHSRYRSADHEYNRQYGTKEQYRVVYRDGFRSGYDEAYRAFTRFGR